MPVRFRRLLLIFLTLLLPVQGFAAAWMSGCMVAAVAAEAVAAEPAGHCHGTTPDLDDSKPVPHQCSHCAACSLASALPVPATARLHGLPATQAPASPIVAPFTGFIPDGPERPPRSRLA